MLEAFGDSDVVARFSIPPSYGTSYPIPKQALLSCSKRVDYIMVSRALLRTPEESFGAQSISIKLLSKATLSWS
jgi:hypothetical protein